MRSAPSSDRSDSGGAMEGRGGRAIAVTRRPLVLWRGGTGLSASFSHRQFRALWTAAAFSNVAQWTLLIARSALAYDLTGGAGSVGLVVFASMLPYVFIPPVGGVLADRFNRRSVVTSTMAVSLLTALAMAVLTLAGVVAVWQLVVLSLVTGAARSVETPATNAMVPGFVALDVLVNAVALMSVVTLGSRLLGPLVTLLILGPFGAGVTFLAAGGLYALAVVFIRRVPRPEQDAHAAEEGPLRQLVDGVRYAAGEPVVGMILLIVLFHCGLTMSYDAVMPMYADEHMGHAADAYSLFLLTIGAGSMLGALTLAGVSTRWHRGWMLLVSGLLSGLAPAALALAMRWQPALLAAVVMGASQALFMALTSAFLQTVTPDRYLGRVMSIYLMIGGGIMAFGNLGTGYLSDRWGTLPVLLIPAVVFTGVVLASLAGTTLRGVYRRGTVPAAAR
jgi:MFS family permease